MYEDLIKQEIHLADDECCIVFDFGCYFPYQNSEILMFEFSLGEEKFEDLKINHRYPNKGYQTITKKYGRKLSKLGYPYIMKLNEQVPMLLRIKVGIKEQCFVQAVFPLQTSMTKERPICGLTLHWNFDEMRFHFISEKGENGVIKQCNWCNYEIEWCNHILLNPPHRMSENSNVLIYDDVITPGALKLSDYVPG